MILLDSLYINVSGGKILLDYLVEEFEKNKLDIFYIFDIRLEGNYPEVPTERKLYIKASLINRYIFYKKNKYRFKKIFCFGNIPPPCRINELITVYTYFHQRLFINCGEEQSLKNKIIIYFKTTYIKLTKDNSTFWLVQNESMKKELGVKYNINFDLIKVLHFYKPLKNINSIKNNNYKTFTYISLASPHKNHIKLIEAWILLFYKNIKPPLHITVKEEDTKLNLLIKHAIQNGVNIINHGYITRQKVEELLNLTTHLVFPSLSESFGLPLIEAVESGCKVIASNLEYTYQVIEPSCTFCPTSSSSIADAVMKSLEMDLPDSKIKIRNEINTIINQLK